MQTRLVGSGYMQDCEFSPEDSQSSPAATLHLMSSQLEMVDTGSAYLNADVSTEHMIVKLDAATSAILLQIDPSHKEFMGATPKSVVWTRRI